MYNGNSNKNSIALKFSMDSSAAVGVATTPTGLIFCVFGHWTIDKRFEVEAYAESTSTMNTMVWFSMELLEFAQRCAATCSRISVSIDAAGRPISDQLAQCVNAVAKQVWSLAVNVVYPHRTERYSEKSLAACLIPPTHFNDPTFYITNPMYFNALVGVLINSN